MEDCSLSIIKIVVTIVILMLMFPVVIVLCITGLKMLNDTENQLCEIVEDTGVEQINAVVNISDVLNADVSVSIQNQTSEHDWNQQTTEVETETVVEGIETVKESTFEERTIEQLKKIEHLFMFLFFILVIFARKNDKNNSPHTYWWAPGIVLGIVFGINLLQTDWIRQLLFT